MDAPQPPGMTPPTELKPPGQPHDAAAAARSHLWIWVLLGGLLVLALAVVFALPSLLAPARQVNEVPGSAPAVTAAPVPGPSPAAGPASTPTPTTPNSTPAPGPSTAGETAAMRERAQRALQGYLQLRARLELLNAGDWGEPDWSDSAARASAGDRYFAQLQFAAADKEYQAALGQLQRLEANRAVMLTSALEGAASALARDDVPDAIAGFEAALRIEPEHPDAVLGIAKARSRGAVIEQMNLGRAAEANGDLDAAMAAYRQAVQLEVDYAAAQTALQRVSAEIDARDFTAAMTQVLNALDAGQTTAAGKALAEAERLRPDDPAVQDARIRLQAMRARAGLNRLRRQAADRVGVEDWQGAMAAYRKALRIDPAAAFARTGLRHAEARAKLNRQFDHYLDKPTRLYSAAPLANAEKLLAAASDAPSDEPRLAKKIARLRQLVAAAGTPVRVTLNSDGETSVVIYHVGRLGKFDRHQLDLRPGDYTVVGSRPGYRDVRKVIRVRPGTPLPPLLVRCEEAI